MVIDYEINLPDYIAKCINKDKPELHCNGQCILMQKIKEKEKRENKKNMLVYEYNSLYRHMEPTVLLPYQPNFETNTKEFCEYMNAYSFRFKNTLFRPPIV